MSKISNIYSSIHFLFKVGSRKGKTQKQIDAMIDRQRPKKKVAFKSRSQKKRKAGVKIPLGKKTVSLLEASKLLNVSIKRLKELREEGKLEIVTGSGVRVTTESLKNLITQNLSGVDNYVNADSDSTTNKNADNNHEKAENNESG